MQPVSVDFANPAPGEAAYLLQMRLPDSPDGESGALMEHIARFVDMYLAAAEPRTARFAQMGGLNWVIAAPTDVASALENMRIDIATTLFGADDGEKVQIEFPPEALFETEIDDVADAEVEALADAMPEQAQPVDDVWAENTGSEKSGSECAWTESPDAGNDDVFVIDDEPAPEVLAIEQTEAFDVEADNFEVESRPEASAEAEDDWDMSTASAAQRAAFDDDSDVFEVDALDIEIVDGLATDVEPATPSAQEIWAVDEAELDEMTEPPVRPAEVDRVPESALQPATDKGIEPEPEDVTESAAVTSTPPSDIAAELAAFRHEMRAIAQTIPGDAASDTLSEFRNELDAIAGAMGQRVDGAAQRVEAAAEQMLSATGHFDGGRLAAAADKAERSAALLETGVSDALSILSAAARAMSDRTPRELSSTSRT